MNLKINNLTIYDSMKRHDMFVPEALAKLSETVKYDDEQITAAKEWISKIKQRALVKEEDHYDEFRENVLVRILRYDRKKIITSASKSGREPDFTFGSMELCVEVKGQDTDLLKPQGRKYAEYKTPMLQATLYKGQGYKNAFCTNYKDYLLIGENSRRHMFNFMDIECDGGKINTQKLQEFLYLFSQEHLIEKQSSNRLVTETIMFNRDITKKFYDLFDQTRKLLIKDISKNGAISQSEAMLHAQTILNRLVFILFVEGRGMVGDKCLFRNQTLNVLKNHPTSKSRGVWDMIKNRLFVYFNEGNGDLDISAFNGGLFDSEIPENVWFADIDQSITRTTIQKDDAELEGILKKYAVNPIIVNMIEMARYDFADKLGPNLLGNIFEKSMSALENAGIEGDLLRKNTGAYYTLENVTSYICRNTIIPYLSKSGDAKTVETLIKEYTDEYDIETLEKKLEYLRILDPACGSGAFLTKTVDILLEIHHQIHEYKKIRDLFQNKNGASLDAWLQEEMSQKIIERNLFGFDLNAKAVEIAKLSLFLKIASKGNRLPDLSSYIVDGNTLNVTILDYDNEKFLEIKTHGGFDIIVGNPPYVEASKIKYVPTISKTKTCGNTFAYFFEKGFSMLKPGGRLGYIVPVSSVSTPRMVPLQKFLVEQSTELKISNYDDRPGKLFEGLEHCRSSIILCKKKKTHTNDNNCKIYTTGYKRWHTKDVGGLFKNLHYINHNEKTDTCIPKLGDEIELSIFRKIFKHDNNNNNKSTHDLKSKHVIYHNAPQYWIRGMNFTPLFSRNGKRETSSHDKLLLVKDDDEATIMTGLLNSSLFYWFFIKTSNCRDLGQKIIDDFPLYGKWSKSELKVIRTLVSDLMKDYKKNSLKITTVNKRTGIQEKETFFAKKSKHIIDKIDDVFAAHYKLSDEENYYIKNFDLDFRMQEQTDINYMVK